MRQLIGALLVALPAPARAGGGIAIVRRPDCRGTDLTCAGLCRAVAGFPNFQAHALFFGARFVSDGGERTEVRYQD